MTRSYKRTKQFPPPELRTEMQALIAAHSHEVNQVASILNMQPQSILKVAGGFLVTQGTILIAKQALAQYRAEPGHPPPAVGPSLSNG